MLDRAGPEIRRPKDGLTAAAVARLTMTITGAWRACGWMKRRVEGAQRAESRGCSIWRDNAQMCMLEDCGK